MIQLFQNKTGTRVAAITILSLGLVFRLYFHSLSQAAGSDIDLQSLPYKFGDWQGADSDILDDRSRNILQLDHYVKRLYKNSKGKSVFLYVGYWKKQNGEHQAAKHSPALCLPSNGWLLEKRSIGEIISENISVPIKKIVAEIKGTKHYFNYYFFTGKTYYSQEWRALLNISIQTFMTGRSDGGIVEVNTAINQTTNSEEQADQSLKEFLQELNPELFKIINHPIASKR